ncbi:MAG: aminotransferase class I/II, partial [Deltaproteobacteria bacterium]|nr:aminotransferase class I/II [Deltaproteobacteria bacterium]
MSTNPFDRVVDRRGQHSYKWNRYRGRDILPMWVADMDFSAPPPVLEAVSGYCDHGVFGYVLPDEFEPGRAAVCRWLEEKHAWPVQREWIVWVPGVVPAFHVACRAYCEPGDAVLVQTPNYPPMLSAPALTGL